MATIEHMHWVLATKAGFDLVTHYHNLVLLFDP